MLGPDLGRPGHNRASLGQGQAIPHSMSVGDWAFQEEKGLCVIYDMCVQQSHLCLPHQRY